MLFYLAYIMIVCENLKTKKNVFEVSQISEIHCAKNIGYII